MHKCSETLTKHKLMSMIGSTLPAYTNRAVSADDVISASHPLIINFPKSDWGTSSASEELGVGAGTSLSTDSLPGCLLAYSSMTYCRSMMTGMLITMVSSATRIVNIGSDGGGAREQDKSVLLQSQSEAPDCSLDGADVHDACKDITNRKIRPANSLLGLLTNSVQDCELSRMNLRGRIKLKNYWHWFYLICI
jgi:hypothetical protein